MLNVRKFKVSIDQEVEISLDMDKYNKEMISNVSEYWGFDGDKEEFLEDLVDFIACKYIKDGYFDPKIEGTAIDGHSGLVTSVNMQINECE